METWILALGATGIVVGLATYGELAALKLRVALAALRGLAVYRI